MPIDAIAAQAASSQQGARTRLSDNYDTFLVLLTAQLQNQDPLAPMDSTQFTEQLVQYSQVEQQIRTNEQLESLVSHYQAASAGTALSYLGRDAVIESDTTTLANGQAVWAYSLSETAENVTLRIEDSRGRTVFETAGLETQGEHLFGWDGRTTSGEAAPDGAYRVVVIAKGLADEDIAATVNVREPIIGVDFTEAQPLVLTPSGPRGLDLIRAILDRSGT
jgi:flagellar basal-body rod modification protein FlgD